MAEPDFIISGAGAVLTRFRAAKKLTLEQVAKKVGSTKHQIAKYEANEAGVTDKRLDALAAAFGITPLRLSYECLIFNKPQIKNMPIAKLGEEMLKAEEQANTAKRKKPKKSKAA